MPARMNCHELAPFDTTNWDSVIAVFSGSPELHFGQHWLGAPDAALRPAIVKIGWSGSRMLFLAELHDDEIATRATRRNEPLYLLGDVFEIFAGVAREPVYIEYHVAPNGVIAQLRWPGPDAIASVQESGLAHFLIEENDSVLRVKIEEGIWRVYGELPASSLLGAGHDLEGQVWEVSFSRYDYNADGSSHVLSSTSPHAKAAYHRRHEWQRIEFLKS